MIKNESNHKTIFQTDFYRLTVDHPASYCQIHSQRTNQLLFGFAIDSAVDTMEGLDEVADISMQTCQHANDGAEIVFEVNSSLWQQKQVLFSLRENTIAIRVRVHGQDRRITNLTYLLKRAGQSNTTQFSKVYVPRFDWQQSQVMIDIHGTDTLNCQQWLSPPPFAYALLNDAECVFCGIAANEGEYNFLGFDYHGDPSFNLTYEGHTRVNGVFESPALVIGFGATENNEAIENYVKWLRSNGYLAAQSHKIIPAWWREPIFCGWGQMRFDYRSDHDGHENGNFVNVCDYCTEVAYREYVQRMEANHLNPGTIIIDMGWAEQPALHTPNLRKWPNLRGFIDQEHRKGRHVLLWYAPVITAGLPNEACMMLEGRPVCPDPTSPVYQAILAEEIRQMLSPEEGCLNADGFKIDFTQNTPSEDGRFIGYVNSFWGLINETNPRHLYRPLAERQELIQTAQPKWGVEILHAYIRSIYENMKKIKPDSVLITHTANPYFSNIVDVLRLNDLDENCQDVLRVMQNRARIAKMCNKNWLIDTDNDIIYNKDRWKAYIQLQPQLGIPDTYYMGGIAKSLETFEPADYELLRQIWQDYRLRI